MQIELGGSRIRGGSLFAGVESLMGKIGEKCCQYLLSQLAYVYVLLSEKGNYIMTNDKKQ